MTVLNKKLLIKIIDDRVKLHGFTRKGSTWLRSSESVILGVNLQRSMYGSLCFINFFAFYPRLSVSPFRSYSKGDFHLGSRGPSTLIRKQEQLLLLDEREVNEQAFSNEVGALWFDETLARLLSFSEIENTRHFLTKNPDELGFYGEYPLTTFMQTKPVE